MGDTSQDNNRILSEQACPLSASVHWDPREDTKQDTRDWLKVYSKLSYQVRMGLVDEQTEYRIVELAKKYQIYRVGEVGELSRILRDSFVLGGFSRENTVQRIIERLKLEEKKAEALFEELVRLGKKISNIEESVLEEVIEKIPIIPAIKKFPEINQQTIGERKIVISGNSEYVKPTIKNWLDDYTLQKGAQSHNNLERSDYVFNSKNIQTLTFEEKKQLLSILESYDEDKDLAVNSAKKAVIFDTAAVTQREVKIIEKTVADTTKIKSEVKPQEQKLETTDTKQKKEPEPEKEENKESEFKSDDNNEALEGFNQSKHIVNLKDI